MPLKGFLNNSPWINSTKLEKKLLSYVNQFGDGWADTNTHRLQCFARVVDALSEHPKLTDYRDKTMAQWFQDAKTSSGESRLKNEYLFYSMRGFPINNQEEWIDLKPGQMVIIDNTRVVHGRIGKRTEKEIYQFMFGLYATPEDIDCFRKSLIAELTLSK